MKHLNLFILSGNYLAQSIQVVVSAPQGPRAAPWRAQPPAEPAQPPLQAASPPSAASAAASAPPAPDAPAMVGFHPPPTKGEQSIQTGQVV